MQQCINTKIDTFANSKSGLNAHFLGYIWVNFSRTLTMDKQIGQLHEKTTKLLLLFLSMYINLRKKNTDSLKGVGL